MPIGTQGSAAHASGCRAGPPRTPATTDLDSDSERHHAKTRPVPTLCRRRGNRIEYHWSLTELVVAATTPYGPLAVGPTLQYGKTQEPTAPSATAPRQVGRIARAGKPSAWPGRKPIVLELLTSCIVPAQGSRVVSFSYRHRPGLSFVNCFHRDNLDLIDDLIHENSHHHLICYYESTLYRDDHNQQIFYSPWRRSLRPVRGILHDVYIHHGCAVIRTLSHGPKRGQA